MIRFILSMLFTSTILCCNAPSNQKDPNSSEIEFTNPNHDLIERAYDFYKEKKYSEALLCFDSLINIDSTNGEYYFKRGFCKSMQSDNEVGAIEDFLKAIEFNYSKKQSAYINIGAIHRSRAIFYSVTNNDRIAEYDSALYFYNKALKIDPSNAKALQEKKEVLESLKKLKE